MKARALRDLLRTTCNPLFLDWSRTAITFDCDDHPDYVHNPRVYPLVVDPIIANTRLTKVLMDRGSQNVVAAAMLLCNMPEPSAPEVHRAHDEI
jgi:hypothetical protein